MRTKIEWRAHPQHGYMLRGKPFRAYDGRVYCMVVTSLCQHMRETEQDPALWEAHKSRLRVNAGSGAIAADLMRENDVNPQFVVIDARRVPRHIKADFLPYL